MVKLSVQFPAHNRISFGCRWLFCPWATAWVWRQRARNMRYLACTTFDDRELDNRNHLFPCIRALSLVARFLWIKKKLFLIWFSVNILSPTCTWLKKIYLHDNVFISMYSYGWLVIYVLRWIFSNHEESWTTSLQNQ